VLTDRNVYPTIQRGALQVAVSSARLAFGDGDRTPLLVRLTPQFAFIALFEGLGEHGSAVAAFCRSQVYEVGAGCAYCFAAAPGRSTGPPHSQRQP
jgi:hypothetical protein